jgi:N-acetylglucosamine-6-phosphate deacetylase
MPEQMILIKDVSVVFPDRVVKDQGVWVRAEKIERIGPMEKVKIDPVAQVVDGRGGFLVPGYIDLHIHGFYEYLIDNGPGDLLEICRLLPRHGTTGFLPSVCPRPAGEDAVFLKTLAGVQSDAARMFGFHLEGPFLTLTGALPPEALGRPDPKRVRALIEAARPYRAIFSTSPDFEGIKDLLPIMTEGGVPAFITHTKATVKQTQAAIEAGARHATHFYDVFPCPEVTEPGVRPCGAIEAVLADPRTSVDFVLDGVHVDPIAVAMALQCKGPDRVCLTTDANVGTGMPPGRYRFRNEEVEFAYPGSPARLTENSCHPGCLAGSGLTQDRAVQNAVKMVKVSLPQAVRMASTNPAKVIGLENQTGRIQEGLDADLVLLDSDLQVQKTWVKGHCAFER